MYFLAASYKIFTLQQTIPISMNNQEAFTPLQVTQKVFQGPHEIFF